MLNSHNNDNKQQKEDEAATNCARTTNSSQHLSACGRKRFHSPFFFILVQDVGTGADADADAGSSRDREAVHNTLSFSDTTVLL